MQPKPEDFSAFYADVFKDQQVVDLYRHRPPYPAEVFDILVGLIIDEPRVVLDVGVGTGDIARHLVELTERVDAVDPSRPMIERGQRLPNGDHPHLHWIFGKVEEVALTPPYALITAGTSIHWTEWELAFPRFRSLLTPNGSLALIYRRTLPMPWDPELRQLKEYFSARRDHKRPHVAVELAARGLFHRHGERETAPVPYLQSVEDFIAGLHSRSGFSRQRMGKRRAADFDRQVRLLLRRHHNNDILSMQVVGIVTWGMPGKGGE